MYVGDIRVSSYAIIVDNCRIPTRSLLERIRTREMMELSASRWNPTPAVTQSSSISSSIDERISTTTTTTTKPAHISHTNLSPKVPLRHVSPPAQKRESASRELSSASTATSAAALESPTFATRKGRPSIPVRSPSPGMQLRSLLGEEGNTSSSSMASVASSPEGLPISPTLPNRHFRHRYGHEETAQERPRMPQRKSSLLKQPSDNEERISKLLKSDDDDTNNMDTSNVSIVLTKPEKRQSLTRRPSIPTRQSSFEILPATVPARQSSFELRHRAASSPLSGKVVALILLRNHPSSPRRSQFSASMPNLSRQDTENLLVTAAQPEPKLNESIPNIHLSLGVASCEGDQQVLSFTKEEEESNRARRTSELDAEQHARPHQKATTLKRIAKEKGGAGSSQFVEQCNVIAPPPEPLAPAASSETWPPSSTLSGSSTSAHIQGRSVGLKGIRSRPPATTPLPRKPVRQFSFNSASSASSSTSSSCKVRRFRRFRPGAATPSSPVRNSSFDYGVERGEAAALGVLPGRQSSFPGVFSPFRKL
jgi:hypothetical protein